jgi:hypothetical protein
VAAPRRRLDRRDVRVVSQRPREPLPECALHRTGHRRRIRRVRGCGRALLLSDPRRLPGRAGGAVDVRRADRLPRAAHVRRGAPDRAVRLRRLGAHPRAGVQCPGTRGLRLHARRRSEDAGLRARARSRMGRRLGGRSAGAARRGDHLRARRLARPARARRGRAGRHGRVRRHLHERDPHLPLQRAVAGAHGALGRQPDPRRRARVPAARSAGAGPHARHELPPRAGQRGAGGPEHADPRRIRSKGVLIARSASL